MNIKKYIIRAALIVAFIACNHVFDGGLFDLFLQIGPAAAQQNLLVQTTLSAAVPVPSSSGAVTGGAAPSPVPYGLVQLASATGITGYTLNPTATLNVQNLWALYVDREEMAVIQINGTAAYVIRGYNSTVATSHASGSMVLYGKALWFYNIDPGTVLSQGGAGVSGGTACTVAGQFAFPWLNVRSGAMWACSPTTLTYVPWFSNPLSPLNSADFGTVASVAGATAVQGPYFRVSGTNAITSWTLPVGFNNTATGSGSFCIYPTAAFTTTATNNIAAATTAVIGKTLCYTWNASTLKFSASY
jgi:hypothetical protein